MRTTHRCVTFVLMAACSSTGWTTSVTNDLADVGLTGVAQWHINDLVVESWNISALSISALAPAQVDIDGLAPANYVSASFIAPIKAIRYDTQTRELLGIELEGAFTFSSPRVGGVSWGGMAEMSGLTIDFANAAMTGAVTGLNALEEAVSYSGTIFSLGRISYEPMQGAQGGLMLEIQELTLNELARQAWIKAVGGEDLLLDLNSRLIANEQGVLSISIASTALGGSAPFISPPSAAIAVPEPSTFALLGLGLIGVIGLRRQSSRP